MKASSFLFNGYIYPMKCKQESENHIIPIYIPGVSEDMILNNVGFQAILQCVCSENNYYIENASEDTTSNIVFELNGITKNTEVRLYPYNIVYTDVSKNSDSIPGITYSNGDIYLLECMNRRVTILPLSNLADVGRGPNNEFLFPFDIKIDGVANSLSQIVETVNSLKIAMDSTIQLDKDGNFVCPKDVQGNGGTISLVDMNTALSTLSEVQQNHTEELESLKELTEKLSLALSELQTDLENVVTYTNEGDIIFKDSNAVEVSLRNFYESTLNSLEEYGNTITAHSEHLIEIDKSIEEITQTLLSLSGTVEGYDDVINNIREEFNALSERVETILDNLDADSYLTLDEKGNLNIDNDLIFNGSTLPEGYEGDSQSLITVITLLANNISSIVEDIDIIRDSLDSCNEAAQEALEISLSNEIVGEVVTDEDTNSIEGSSDAPVVYLRVNGYTLKESEKYLKSLTEDSSTLTTNNIPCKYGDTITLKCNSYTSIDVSLFDSSGALGILPISSAESLVTEIDIPVDIEGTEYVVISIKGATTSDVEYLKVNGNEIIPPTPDAPIDIQGLGDSGVIEVKTCGKNMLNPTLETTTLNGVTCTNNGDGTYTVNGTATDNTEFIICSFYFGDESYKLIGTPKGISNAYLYIQNSGSDAGDGLIVTGLSSEIIVGLYINSGTVLSNAIFKPMITTDLEATYDDYEPYQGETTASIPITAPLYDGDYMEVYADGSGKLYRKYKRFVPTTVKDVIDSLGCRFSLDGVYCKNTLTSYSNYFTPYDYNVHANNHDGTFVFANNSSGAYSDVYVKIDGLTTKEEYQAWLDEHNDLEFVYELTNPVEEPLTAEQVEQFKQLRTFQPITHIDCDGQITLRYYNNTDNGEVVGDLHDWILRMNSDVDELDTKIESTDIQYGAYTKNEDGSIVQNGETTSTNIKDSVSQINDNTDVLLQGHNELNSKVSEMDKELPLAKTSTGTNPTIQDSTHAPWIYGKFNGYTVQDGTPTPDAPIDIQGLGDSGVIEVKTYRKNLLDPKFVNLIQSGITCMNNYDGTCTLNGTTTADVSYKISTDVSLAKGEYKIVGCPKNGDTSSYYMEFYSDLVGTKNDTGNGNIITVNEDCTYSLTIYIKSGTTVSNLVFKPMITTDLSATYDDFFPYTETTASIPITAPLYDGDYMEVYADGSGKIVRTNAKIDSYSSEVITTDYVSTTGELSDGATVVYKLETPTEEPLTAEQVQAFKQLYTFDNVTNVFCDGETTVRYYVNNDCSDTIERMFEIIQNEKQSKTLYLLKDKLNGFSKQTYRPDSNKSCYGNGKFVTYNYNGNNIDIVWSYDGVNWNKGIALDSTFYTMGYANGKFIVVSENTVCYSEDAVTWTKADCTIDMSDAYSKIVYGNGLYVSVGINTVYYSQDSINWSTTEVRGSSFTDVAYGNGLFVAVDENMGRRYYSKDGVTWTKSAEDSSRGSGFYGVEYGDGIFVAVGYSGRVEYSMDGINWISLEPVSNEDCIGLVYGNNKFVFVCKDNNTYYIDSNNIDVIHALNQIDRTPNTPNYPSYGNGKFLLISTYVYLAEFDKEPMNTEDSVNQCISDIDNLKYEKLNVFQYDVSCYTKNLKVITPSINPHNKNVVVGTNLYDPTDELHIDCNLTGMLSDTYIIRGQVTVPSSESVSVALSTEDGDYIEVELDSNGCFNFSSKLSGDNDLSFVSSLSQSGYKTYKVSNLEVIPTTKLFTLIEQLNVALSRVNINKVDKDNGVFNKTLSLGRQSNSATGYMSVALGSNIVASGQISFGTGYSNKASDSYSFAEGYQTEALKNQHSLGHFNNTSTATENSTSGTSTGTAFVIGNGSNASSCSNAFRVTGDGTIYATNSTVQAGADYAEYFEWSDKNPDAEDRVGHFVTFDENNPDKIRFASEDDYILGVVSGMPNVIGNGDEDWKQRYVLDEFGRYIVEEFEYEEVVGFDEETEEPITETKIGTKWKENPEYDDTRPYVPRSQRPEWSAVGMLGVLSVYDDGTCEVNSYCKCSNNGIATSTEDRSIGYRVIARVTNNIIKIVLK